MQQENNKTKASPAAAREGCHFSARFPARWEKPPKGPFDERDGQLLEGFQCRKPPRTLKCKDVPVPLEPLGSGCLLHCATWLLY